MICDYCGEVFDEDMEGERLEDGSTACNACIFTVEEPDEMRDSPLSEDED